MPMASMENSQILKLFLIASLLIVTPLLSAPVRSKFLYFIVNILIVAVGAEAGLLSFFFDSPRNEKRTSPLKPHAYISEENPFVDQCNNSLVLRCSSEKIVDEEQKVAIEKSPSTPSSIFFIEEDPLDEEEEEEREEVREMSSDQELFQKAEMFIGDFYKQLKMQREDSLKKLHNLYHKAF